MRKLDTHHAYLAVAVAMRPSDQPELYAQHPIVAGASAIQSDHLEPAKNSFWELSFAKFHRNESRLF